MIFLIIILTCYVTVALIRKTKIPNECLPLISGGFGLLLGLVAFYVAPSLVHEQSIGTTLTYGFFCGLAATGSNQVVKQAIKFIKAKYNINISVPTVTPNNKSKE